MTNTLPVVTDPLTKEQFLRVLPKKFSKTVSDDMINNINGLLVDPNLRENFRDNLLSYTGVMKDGRYKLTDYVSAVKYVSHRLLGTSRIESYTKTFPDRFQRMLDDNMTTKQISSFSSAYDKTALVTKITEQTLVPTYIINQDMYQRAINKQASIMDNEDASFKVQSEAANSLLTHLKMPETTKIELDINLKEDSAISELRATTLELVKQQKLMAESGAMTIKEIAHSKILIEGTVVEVKD